MSERTFEDLLAEALDAFDRLTPEQQQAHRREQAISFVYGNVSLHNPNITREMVEREYAKKYGEKR